MSDELPFCCVAPAQSIATFQASCASLSEPVSFPDPAKSIAACGIGSIAEPPTSGVGLREGGNKVYLICRASGVCDVEFCRIFRNKQ